MNIDQTWTLTFGDGIVELISENVAPEGRPKLEVEEEEVEEDGKKIFRPKTDKDGNICCRWLPLLINNVQYLPSPPEKWTSARLELKERNKVLETWYFQDAKPQFVEERVWMTFSECRYEHGEESLGCP